MSDSVFFSRPHNQFQYNPDKHHRRSYRLKGYDYSRSGAYFVTICTYQRQQMFGSIVDGKMVLNELGMIVQQCWCDIPRHFLHTELDEYVVMPNHVHGIIMIHNVNDRAIKTNARVHVYPAGVQNFEPLRRESSIHQYQHIIPRSIGSIVRGFKIGVTKWVRQNTSIHGVWQRNYHDWIIRDDEHLKRVRQYIINNPQKWSSDDAFYNKYKD